MWFVSAFLILFSTELYANAHIAQEDAIYQALINVTDWLTNEIGLAAGTLAIVGAGFACITGRIPYLFLRSILIGLGFIFGAAFLAQRIIGA